MANDIFGDVPNNNNGSALPEMDFASFLSVTDERPLPPIGTYTLRVVNVEPKHNETTGSFGFNWTFTIVGGDFDGTDVYNYTYAGVMVNGKLTEIGKGFSTRNMFKAIGLTPEASPDSFDKKTGAIKDLRAEAINRMFVADMVYEIYNDQKNIRPKRVYPTDPPFKKFSADVL